MPWLHLAIAPPITGGSTHRSVENRTLDESAGKFLCGCSYGAYASAEYMATQIAGAKFIGFSTGGHTWFGHEDEVMAAIVNLLLPLKTQVMPRQNATLAAAPS